MPKPNQKNFSLLVVAKRVLPASALKKYGHQVYDLTLSVGLGTFRPIETKKVEHHSMHAEEYFISKETKSIIRNKETRRLAIGTTCVRAIEHYLSQEDLDLEKNPFN